MLHRFLPCVLAFSVTVLAAWSLPAQSPPVPQAVLDLGTGTGRLAVQGPTPGREILVVVGTSLLPASLSLPGVTGSLVVDPASGSFPPGQLDGLGRFEISVLYTNPPRGMKLLCRGGLGGVPGLAGHTVLGRRHWRLAGQRPWRLADASPPGGICLDTHRKEEQLCRPFEEQQAAST